MAICNRYKDTLDHFINNSDIESPNSPGLIDKRSRNTPKSEGSLTGVLEGNYLDKDVSDRSSWLARKTGDS